MPKNSRNTKNSHKKTASKIISKKLITDSDDEDLDLESPKNVTKKRAITQNTEAEFEKKIDNIREALKENYLQQKKLMNDLKELMSLHKRELKLSSKSGNRSNCGKHTGFNKPEPVPQVLRDLLGIEEDELPRSKVTRLLYQYFTDNGMYNSKTKKEIIPNNKIKKIFKMNDNDIINFYNLQTWLKKVYINEVTDNLN